MCNDPGQLDNGKIVGSDYSYNSSIKFECDSGYNLRGLAALTCKRGLWEGPFPECKSKYKQKVGLKKNILKVHPYNYGTYARCKSPAFISPCIAIFRL